MAFEEIKKIIEEIKFQTKEYVDASLTYYKLLIIKNITKFISGIITLLLILFFSLLILVFLSIAFAIYLGQVFNSIPLGFIAVAGLYLLLLLIIVVFKSKIIDRPLLKKYSELFFNQES